jgi:hypothetical protein
MGHEEARQVLVLANICGPCIPVETEAHLLRRLTRGGRGPGPREGSRHAAAAAIPPDPWGIE